MAIYSVCFSLLTHSAFGFFDTPAKTGFGFLFFFPWRGYNININNNESTSSPTPAYSRGFVGPELRTVTIFVNHLVLRRHDDDDNHDDDDAS